MGDGMSGVDGSASYRRLESKFDKMEQIIAEILYEEPHLVELVRQKVEEVINLKRKEKS